MISSEHLLNLVDVLNKDWETKEWEGEESQPVLIGADAGALYLNLRKEKSVRMIAEEFLNSELEI